MSAAGAEKALAPEEVRRWSRIGVLAACAIILSYLETFIPIPIPGVKLGLANIAVLVALGRGDVAGAAVVALIKVGVTGLLFGSPLMLAYSVAGTALSLAAMAPLSRLATMHIAMTSIVGALAHEAGQLIVARVILGTPLVFYTAPVLVVAGIATGAFSGAVAARALALDAADAPPPTPNLPAEGGLSAIAAPRNVHSADVRVALVVLLTFAVITLRAADPAVLAACLAAALAACAAGRVGARQFIRALLPVATILAITLVMQVATTQDGDVLASIGPVDITREALRASLRMAARLVAITAASLAFMRLVDADELVDFSAKLLSPLSRIGIDVTGPRLALATGISFVPVLMARADAALDNVRRAGTRPHVADLVASLLAEADALADAASAAAAREL